MTSKQNAPPPIAIIGIGLRLPGGISTPEQFWSLLINKTDARCRVPGDRYNVDAFHGKETHRQTVACENGYFLEDVNLKAFDSSFFPAKRSEVEVTDPQQRLLLEVVWECMESACQTGLRGTNTGVFVGAFGEDWHNMSHRDNHISSAHRIISGSDYILANRISHEYDLRGPSTTIRTACSSSMTGLHQACQALRNGDCEAAIVAGSSIIMDPSMTLDMSERGVLSPTGSCKTFDAAADGFARGEAVNAILIKPLDNALHDGDPIRAVIRSTAINSDGRTAHVGCPNPESQEALIRRAYEAAGIDDFSQTPFIECHGTGTIAGDPLEVSAVASVFGESGAYIGSVKSNVGHGEGASGLTSIIKAVLSLENEIIPPNVNFFTPNPKIPFKDYKLEVPVDSIPWPKDRHARISINNFGIGGANAHAILDSAASFGVSKKLNGAESNGNSTCRSNEPRKEITNGVQSESSARTPNENGTDTLGAVPNGNGTSTLGAVTNGASNVAGHTGNGNCDAKGTVHQWLHLLPVSASSAKSLALRIDGLRRYIESHPGCLDDVAYTLGLGRIHLSHRSFCVVENSAETLEFSAVDNAYTCLLGDRKIAYVFTGQGAQWAGMAKSLVEDSPSFCRDIREMDTALQRLDNPPVWTIKGVLSAGHDDKDLIEKAELSQPLTTAIQIALVNFLSRCGITCDAVVGHSSGEIAAAYTAGLMTMSEAIVCSYLRGQVTKRQTRIGNMAAIGMGYEAVLPYLVDGAQIACQNSPTSVTISGDSDAVKQTLTAIKADLPDAFSRILHINVAYHSHHMREVGADYEELLTPHLVGNYNEPRVPFYSTVYGKVATSETQFGPAYWRSNLESTVLFHGAVRQLLSDLPQVTTVLEIGPHAALRGPLRQIFQERSSKQSPNYIPTLLRDSDAMKSALGAVGRLYACGHTIDFAFVNRTASLLNDLPNYPWDHGKDFWKESRISQAWRLRKNPHHELLGSRCPESTDLELAWRNALHYSDVLWLRDHKVEERVLFPCAGYIATMGEAIRQVLGSNAYVLRKLVVKAALILPETETIEIRTTMRPMRLSGFTNSSSWYDLSICTFNGTFWVENCIAQGSSGETDGKPITELVYPHQRQISTSYAYERFHHLGLKFGPRFQRLDEISADTKQYIAAAAIRNDESEKEAKYTAHPTTIDCCLQLLCITSCRGIARNMDSLSLPVDIERIIVNPSGPELIAEATMDNSTKSGDAVIVTKNSGRLVVKMENAKCIPLDTGGLSSRHEALDLSRIEWLPDIDCLIADDLIRRSRCMRSTRMAIEKIATVGILQTLDVIQSLDNLPSGHLAKYSSWLEREKETMLQGGEHALIREEQEWSLMTPGSREALLDSLLQEVKETGDPIAMGCAQMIYDSAQRESIEPIFTGEVNPVEGIAANDRLNILYELQREAVSAEKFLQLCAHAKPTLRVLEIGAGTGSTTADTLKLLVSKGGVRMFSQYVFTDTSPGFLATAKERFGDQNGMEYKVLNIEKDPVEQGFELRSYDLIIASDVLRATSSLQNSLRNVYSLLCPGGRLYLAEMVKPLAWQSISFVTGRLSGWWIGDEDGRLDVPFVSIERWDKELRDAGFSGTDTVLLDDEAPYYTFAHITSRAVATVSKVETVIFLYKEERHEFALNLADILEQDGVMVQWSKLDQKEQHSEGDHIISTIDLEGPFLHEISERDYTAFIEYLSNLKGGVLWLTRSAQVGCTDPRYGLINGLARTIRVELSLSFWTVELQRLDPAAAMSMNKICRKFYGRPLLNSGLDSEYSVHDDIVRIGRYHWTSLHKALEPKHQSDDSKHLMIGKYGMIDSLHWVQQESKAPRSNEVEIDIRCVGLNFKDIMVTMGLIQSPKDVLGFECSGVVTRVGSAVDNIQVGDRVLASSNGMLATRKSVPCQFVKHMPERFSFEEAATMSIAYLTVLHAVVNLGQLQKGQSILIHSATGSVGQVAIHVCQTIGAEIYATVGSEEKTNYLVENHGILRDRIFSSRNALFLDGVMQATHGIGVDIVLNSLSGDLLHASWQCVAKFGKMMELGKRDMLEHGHVALDMFQHNRAFYGIDLDHFPKERPEVVIRLMDQMLNLVDNHHAKPIEPIHTFPCQKISEAMRFMKKGEHMGKVVITIPEDIEEIPAVKATKSTLLSDTSTYLMVGGLGGLGKAVATWMVERGARSFCFLSRSAGKSHQDQAFFKELESQGCSVAAVAGSVVEMADVEKAIDASPTPIAGVLQMSMVLRDSALLQTSYDDWRNVQACKVKGTWNLHNALSGGKLDFFILLASLAGAVGHPGQANYSSANSFLDSFVQYRHGLNLPCSAIDLGGMEGIGCLSDKPVKLLVYRSSGLNMLQEQHLMDAIELGIQYSLPADNMRPTSPYSAFTNMSHFAVGMNSTKPISDPMNRTIFKGDPRISVYNNIVFADQKNVSESQEEGVRELLREVEANPELLREPDTVNRASWEIGRTLFGFLLLPEENLDVSMSLTSIGVDSLVSIEIRNWWRRTLGMDIMVLEVLNAGTIEGLGKLIVLSLQKKYGIEGEGGDDTKESESAN